MKKVILASGLVMIAGAGVGENLISSSCRPLSSSEYEVTAVVPGALSVDATLSVGSVSGLVGEITTVNDNNSQIRYIGAVNCDGQRLQIIDGAITYVLDH